MSILLLRILGAVVCVGVIGFGSLMIHDFSTDYRRFQRINQRRDSRKKGRS